MEGGDQLRFEHRLGDEGLALCGPQPLDEIRKMREIRIIVSEQVLSFAMYVADRLFVIEGGRLVHETSRAGTDVAHIKQYLSV